jgi:cytochrome c oxidase subunit 1
MSSHAHTGHAVVVEPSGFIRKYIFSIDHKVIGIQYFLLALTAVCVGIVLSLLMRFHLVYPGAHLPLVSGGIMTPEQYLALVTMHGTIMVFFVLTTAPQGGFGNYFLPIQIGAPDMAFPRLNMLSFWVTFLAFVAIIAAFVVPGGAPISGWTGYTPLSGMGEVTGPGEGMGQTLWIVSISLFCLASLLGALNFIATTIDLRAPGHDAVPHASHCLGLVRDCNSRTTGVRRPSGRRNSAASRPLGWDQFLPPRRPCGKRSVAAS